MTVIKKLTAHGFKSFAKPTEIPFGTSFNCIIGPNGSGKSNVVDLICFVLGKSSAKSLRAEKSANLIYNGGKKGKPAKQASASIYFDNKNQDFPIKDKEVKITRIVKSSGNSVYKINDETRTRQQVIDLLRGARIEPDGHNIILQGDIVHFMGMKGEERRELIEEIAGISVYEDKKEKAMKELEKVSGKLSEAEIVLTEREAYLRELKTERDQALKFRKLETQIKSNKATLIHKQIKEKQEKVDEIQKKIDQQEKELKSLKEETTSLKEEINSKKDRIKEINSSIEQKGGKDQVEIHKEIEEVKTELVRNKSRIETCKTEINKINQRKTQLKQNITELENKITNLKNKKQDLIKKIEELNKQKEKEKQKIDAFKQEHKLKEIDSVSTEVESIESKIEEAEANIQNILTKKQELQRTKDQKEVQLNHLNEKLKELSSVAEEDKKNIDLLKNKRADFKKIVEKLSKAQNENVVYLSQLQKARDNLLKNNEELSKLNVRQLTIKESVAGDLAIKKILGLNDKGVYGTVSDLGKVDQKYALALEIAAGARIKSIVVDNDKTAEKCISYLKQNKLGTATFLPLNKIKERVMDSSAKQLQSLSGVKGLALDLVSFDSKFKKVFSYVFGPTVVVDNISTARRIGIGRIRMVTMEGDLVEVSGAMVGGFRRRERSFGFQEKQVSSNILDIEAEISRLKKIIESVESKWSDNENLIQDLKINKSELEGEIIKLEKLTGSTGDSSSLSEEISILKKELAEINKNLSTIDAEIGENQTSIKSLKETRKNLKQKIIKSTSPEITSALQELESKYQNIKEQIIEINPEIKNIEGQITNIHEPEKQKILQIINQHNKETEDFKKEIEELSDLEKQQKQNLTEKEKEEKTFYSEYKGLFAERNKLSQRIEKIENTLSSSQEKIEKVQDRINNTSIGKAKFVAEKEGLEKEFEEFKDEKIRKGIDIQALKQEIRDAESQLMKIGNVNMRALDVCEEAEKEYNKILEKTEKLKLEKDDVLNMMNEIETKKTGLFMDTFKVIEKNFRNIFSSLSTKGEAQLTIEDPETPLESGVDIRVKLAGTKYMDIKSLSGGEKTMAALAFIFAIQEHDPASFYLLDEVDAALDKKNSELLSKLVAKYSDRAQYIVISHNDNVISEAELVYGVSMQNGISNVVSLKL